MRSRIGILVCLIVGALALLTAGPALAQGGTTTSAGDQQYTDPLANTNTNQAPPPSTSPPSSSTTSAPSSSAPSSGTPSSSTPSAAPSSAPQPATTSGTATPTTSADPSGTLPFTGLNVGLVVVVGLCLLGAGVLLRSLTRRA